jgi:hypothetical protein
LSYTPNASLYCRNNCGDARALKFPFADQAPRDGTNDAFDSSVIRGAERIIAVILAKFDGVPQDQF